MISKKLYIICILLPLIYVGSNSQNAYSLKDCKQLSIKNNAKVKNSTLEIKASEEIKAGLNTKYYPNVSAGFIGFKSAKDLIEMETQGGNLPVYDGDPAHLGNATMYAYMPGSKMSLLNYLATGNITIAQPIYVGGKISTANDLADLGKQVSEDKFVLNKNEVLLRTEELFRQVATLNEKMKTLVTYEQFLDTIHHNAESAFNAGLATKNDVLKVDIKLSEIQINKLKLGNGIELAKMALCQQIGLQYSAGLVFSEPNDEPVSPDSLFREQENSLLQCKEYSLLKKSIVAEELQSKLKFGDYLPEFSAGAMFFYVNVMDKGNVNAMLFANLSIPVSGWWEASHTMEERKVREEMARNSQEDVTGLLRVRITKSWNDVTESYKQIDLAKKLIIQSRQNLKEYESNYNAGIINFSDLLEARAVLQQSYDQLTEVKANYQNSITRYLQATGRYE